MQKEFLIDFDDLCYKLNDVAGKLDAVTKTDLAQQLELIKEELNETIRDLQSEDYVGVLDGYADLMVTVFGLGQMLRAAGFKTYESLVATAENNDTKFIPSDKVSLVDQTVKMYMDQGVKCYVVYNEDYDCYVVKDTSNKIRKPVGFVSNDLSMYVPVGFK